MLINKVAQKYGITIRTLRYYEEIGLLKLSRNESNIRQFDDIQIKKLEQILIYKMLNFSLTDIRDILMCSSNEVLNIKLNNELKSLDNNIQELTHKQKLLRSLLKTFGSNDISKHNIQEFIGEQIYFNKDDERLITMLTNTETLILEIGKNLIPIATNESENSLIQSIKALRYSLYKNYSIEVDKIRLRDNINDLLPNEYQIIKDGNVIVRKLINTPIESLQIEHIITNLKSNLL